MTTHVLHERTRSRIAHPQVSAHWAWLGGGMALGFLVPFVLADTLDLQRDLYYGLYGASVVAYVAAWLRWSDESVRRLATRRLGTAVVLGAAAAAVLAAMVFRTEDETARPGGIDLVAAIAWRGVFYGLVDGLVLSAFPILVVFAAFRGSRLVSRRGGKVAVAAAALVASLAMTAVYHLGYSDFRGDKLGKPVAGDVVWSAPTLITLNPVGAPIAHAALHTAAVVHSSETDTFLPPHE